MIWESIYIFGFSLSKIQDYLYSVKNYEGAVGKLTIDDKGEPILEFSVKQVKNRELVTLK